MRGLLALAIVLAACDATPLDVPPRDFVDDVSGRWVSPWVYAGTDAEGDYNTRYVLQVVENTDGTCTAMLFCECSNPAHTPPTPGNHFWEGTLSFGVLSLQSTNLVTGDTGTLTATVDESTLGVTFSWGEAFTFTRID